MAFQYVVKFICGKGGPRFGVAPGTYYTAINVHNPAENEKEIYIEKKFALARPCHPLPEPEEGEQPGPYMRQFETAKWPLEPDQALEIDCPDIFHHTDELGCTFDFRKGFVVIRSDVELDVVAVYTVYTYAKGLLGGVGVTTLHIERVLPKEV